MTNYWHDELEMKHRKKWIYSYKKTKWPFSNFNNISLGKKSVEKAWQEENIEIEFRFWLSIASHVIIYTDKNRETELFKCIYE